MVRPWWEILSATAAAMLIATTAATAVMPPHYQRAKEMAAAIDAAAAVLTVLDLIDRVEYTAEDKITVRAGRCAVLVDIVDTPRPAGLQSPGPRMFEARVKSRSCN